VLTELIIELYKARAVEWIFDWLAFSEVTISWHSPLNTRKLFPNIAVEP